MKKGIVISNMFGIDEILGEFVGSSEELIWKEVLGMGIFEGVDREEFEFDEDSSEYVFDGIGVKFYIMNLCN